MISGFVSSLHVFAILGTVIPAFLVTALAITALSLASLFVAVPGWAFGALLWAGVGASCWLARKHREG